MPVPDMLVALTRRFNLPLAVRCTSVLLYARIRGRLALGPQQLAHLALFMGCKFEDIHAHLERLLVGAGCRKEEIGGLVECEAAAFEHIGFDFAYPNLYVKAQGMRILLAEHDAAARSAWEDDCACIDRALCSEPVLDMCSAEGLTRDERNVLYNEVAFAAIDADSRACESLGLQMRADSVERIRRLIKDAS